MNRTISTTRLINSKVYIVLFEYHLPSKGYELFEVFLASEKSNKFIINYRIKFRFQMLSLSLRYN